MASQEGLEPPTHVLEGHCSIRMSYWLSRLILNGHRARPRDAVQHFRPTKIFPISAKERQKAKK
jgi:hypothetical protein